MANKNYKDHDNHHHHKHVDDSEIFKQKTLSASRRRKRFARILYKILWVVAIAIIAMTIYVYTN